MALHRFLKLAVECVGVGVFVLIEDGLELGFGGDLIGAEGGESGSFIRIGLEVEELAGAVELVVMVEGKLRHGEVGPPAR